MSNKFKAGDRVRFFAAPAWATGYEIDPEDEGATWIATVVAWNPDTAADNEDDETFSEYLVRPDSAYPVYGEREDGTVSILASTLTLITEEEQYVKGLYSDAYLFWSVEWEEWKVRCNSVEGSGPDPDAAWKSAAEKLKGKVLDTDNNDVMPITLQKL